MFDIQFENLSSDELDGQSQAGRLVLGAQEVLFRSSLEFWGLVDYELQWRRGIRYLLEGGDRSCLITSITNPATANFLVWWLIYRGDSKPVSMPSAIDNCATDNWATNNSARAVEPTGGSRSVELFDSISGQEEYLVFQNQILMLDDIRSELDLMNLQELVPEREPLFFVADDSEIDRLLAPDKTSDRGTQAEVPSEQTIEDLSLSHQNEFTRQDLTFREWTVPLGSVRNWYQSTAVR